MLFRSLDIETLDLLEEFLLNYPGTVLIVSHDREFLNNVVTSTLVMEGNGVVKEYAGGYDDWLRQSQKAVKLKQPREKSPPKKTRKKQTSDRLHRLSFKEKKELEAIPKLIETLEAEQQQLRSEEHTSELQSHSFISYAVFCLKKKQDNYYNLPNITE